MERERAWNKGEGGQTQRETEGEGVSNWILRQKSETE